MGNSTSHPSHLKFRLIDNKYVAEQLLADAEAIDFYLETCRHHFTNERARRRLTYAVNSITPDEFTHYQSILNAMVPRLPKRLQMDLHEIDIIPLMPSADAGMPHTRPYQLVCFPQLDQIRTSMSTVIHELWHVHQRKYMDTWTNVFRELGWTEWSGSLSTFLEKNRRLNPDTIDSPLWAYQDTWVPVPIFRDISLPTLNEVTIWFYHIKEDYHVTHVPKNILTYFPNLPQSAYEHPREITAYLLADPQQYHDSPAMKRLLSSVGQLAIS